MPSTTRTNDEAELFLSIGGLFRQCVQTTGIGLVLPRASEEGREDPSTDRPDRRASLQLAPPCQTPSSLLSPSGTPGQLLGEAIGKGSENGEDQESKHYYIYEVYPY